MVSLALVLLSLAGFGLRKEKAFGIDFTGGTLIQFQLGKEVNIPLADVEKALKPASSSQQSRLSRRSRATPPPAPCSPSAAIPAMRTAITDKLREAIPALGELKAEPDRTAPDYKIDSSKEEVSALIGGTFLQRFAHRPRHRPDRHSDLRHRALRVLVRARRLRRHPPRRHHLHRHGGAAGRANSRSSTSAPSSPSPVIRSTTPSSSSTASAKAC